MYLEENFKRLGLKTRINLLQIVTMRRFIAP